MRDIAAVVVQLLLDTAVGAVVVVLLGKDKGAARPIAVAPSLSGPLVLCTAAAVVLHFLFNKIINKNYFI